MKFKMVVLVLMMSVFALAGCQTAEPAQTEDVGATDVPALSGDRDWTERGLAGMNLLSLGTLNLEETENAVTPEQAGKLLPLWQLIQEGSLQSAAETDAVVEQIEGQMTDAQLAAIEEMELTMDDYQAWMEAQGIEMPTAGGGQGGPGNLEDLAGASRLSDEERAAMREQMQGLRDLSPEERATAMAEMGIERPEGAGQGSGGGFGGGRGFGGGAGAGNPMLTPLIEMLMERSGG